MTDRSRRRADAAIIEYALELLVEGLLPSDLPQRLMTEFGITADRARELADKAIELHKNPVRPGKLDTKPFDEPG